MSDAHTNYQEHLESYAWKALKKMKLEEQSECECCWAPATSVHHLSYKRLWREKPDDIVSICERCHDECHHVWWYQIKNDEEILRRRFEEVKNIYLWEIESGNVELKELFKHKFSQEKISTFIHSYSGQWIINWKNYATLQLLGEGRENILLDDTNISGNSINKLWLIWDNPYFKVDNGLYYAYKINYFYSDNNESISESEINRYYLLKLSCFDVDSFEFLNESIVKDKLGVYLVKYYKEFNWDWALEIKIYKTSIDSSWFRWIGWPYYKNSNKIYCEIGNNFYYSFPENIIHLKWADLETFEILDNWRARDINCIYENWKIVEIVPHKNENNDYSIWSSWGCSYGEYWEDCKTLFSDRSDWCSCCKGE